MLRRAVFLALVSSLALAVWASAGDARTSKQPLRVAIVIPKSGAFSIHNQLIANGATVAAREIDAGAGGKTVPLKLSVVRVSPTAAPKRIVRKLVRASTHVIILPCNVKLQQSLAGATAKAGLLALSPCNADPKLAKGLKRYWPTGPTEAAEVGQLVFYAKYVLAKAKTAFLLGPKGSWYASQVTGPLRAAVKKNGLRVVGSASVPAASHNFAQLAKRIRQANPAIIFSTIPSPSIESVITALRSKGVRSPFYVTDGMDAAINFDKYRDGPYDSMIEDVVFATFGFPRPTSAQFTRDYAAAYGKKPLGSFPGLGYETIHVLETAARRAPALTPAGLNESFAKGFTVPGVALEDISYQGHGHRQPVTSVGIAQVIRNAYVELFSSVAGHPTG